MAKTKKKVTVKKAAKPVAKSAKKTAKPAPKKAVKPAIKKKVAAKPAAKKAAFKKTVKPAPKKAAKPIAKKKTVAKPVVKKAVKPVAKKKAPVKPVVKKAAKPAPKKSSAGSVAKAVKPVAKKVAKPAPKKTVKAPAKVVKPAPKKALTGSTAKPVKPVISKKAEQTAAKPVAAPKREVPKVPAKPKVKEKKVVHEALPAKALITIQKNIVEEEKPQLIAQQLRYSDEDLKEFKAIIDKKLDSARDELNYLKESLENHTDSQEGNKAWNLEEGADTSEMEYLMNQISRQNKFIRDLEMALVRIENKTYGVCRATGKLIDKNRLRIVPHATLSIEAKNSRKGDDIAPNTSATSAHMGSEGEGFGNDEN